MLSWFDKLNSTHDDTGSFWVVGVRRGVGVEFISVSWRISLRSPF